MSEEPSTSTPMMANPVSYHKLPINERKCKVVKRQMFTKMKRAKNTVLQLLISQLSFAAIQYYAKLLCWSSNPSLPPIISSLSPLNQEKKKRRKAAEEMREAMGDEAPPKQVPHTIESLRPADITTVDADDEEVENLESHFFYH